MNRETLVKLFDAGDLLALVCYVNRSMLESHFPNVRYAVLMGVTGPGAPDLMLPVMSHSSLPDRISS